MSRLGLLNGWQRSAAFRLQGDSSANTGGSHPVGHRDPLILPYEINETKPFFNKRLALESLQGGAL